MRDYNITSHPLDCALSLLSIVAQPARSRGLFGDSGRPQTSNEATSLLSIPRKALLASALSRAASCLSSSETSIGSIKLRVERAGDGIEDGGVVGDKDEEDCGDSLMIVERAAFN